MAEPKKKTQTKAKTTTNTKSTAKVASKTVKTKTSTAKTAKPKAATKSAAKAKVTASQKAKASAPKVNVSAPTKSKAPAAKDKTPVKTVKKAAPKLKTVAPKSAPAVLTAQNNTSGGFFKDWVTVLDGSVKSWSSIVWKFVGVLGLGIGLQFIINQILYFGLLLIGGGSAALESLVANLSVGTYPTVGTLVAIVALVAFWAISSAVVMIMAKLGTYAVVKNYLLKKPNGVWQSFYTEALPLVLRYIALWFKILVIVSWPFVVLMLSLGVISVIPGLNTLVDFQPVVVQAQRPVPMPSYMALYFFAANPLLIPLALAALGYGVWQAIRVLFALPALVYQQQNSQAAIATSRALVDGAWWYIAGLWALFVAALYGFNVLFYSLAYLDPIKFPHPLDPAYTLGLFDLLAFLLSLFILAPITTSFLYHLMLKAAEKQSVKL